MSFKFSGIMKDAAAVILGLLFGLGLIISGMSNPKKVIDFLDVSGQWDPSLAFVMAAALTSLIFIQRKLKLPFSDQSQSNSCDAKPSTNIDLKLIAGAGLFGIGWGLSGICPGPAFVGLTSRNPGSLVFWGCMMGGFLIYQYTNKNKS